MELFAAVELLAKEICFISRANQFEDKTECLVQHVPSADNLDTVITHLNLPFSYLLSTILPAVFRTNCVSSVVQSLLSLAEGWVWLHESAVWLSRPHLECCNSCTV